MYYDKYMNALVFAALQRQFYQKAQPWAGWPVPVWHYTSTLKLVPTVVHLCPTCTEIFGAVAHLHPMYAQKLAQSAICAQDVDESVYFFQSGLYA